MRHAIARIAFPVTAWALLATGCAGGLDNREAIKEALSSGSGGSTTPAAPNTDDNDDDDDDDDGGGGDSTPSAGTTQPSNGGEPAGESEDYPNVVEEILKMRCGGCHGMSNPLGGLDLVSDDIAGRLDDKTSSNATCEDGDAKVLNLADPESSQLYQRLLEDPDCGLRMPMGAEPLSDEEIGWILAWIKDGAPDDPDADSAPEPSAAEPDGSDTADEDPAPTDPEGETDMQTDTGALDRSSWIAASNPMQSGGNAASNAIDGQADSRFTTGQFMQGGEWLRIDMGSAQTIARVVVDSSESATDSFKSYSIYVTDNPDQGEWGTALAQGNGDSSGLTDIMLDEPATGRYLVVEQNGSDADSWWSVYELNVYP